MTSEIMIERINDSIKSYHAKRRGEEGLTIDEAVAVIKAQGFSEGDAMRWLTARPGRGR